MEHWLALLALGVAPVVGVIAYLLGARSQRRQHASAATTTSGQDDIAVLSVLPQAVMVLESDDEVQLASAGAHALGLVRNDTLVHQEILEMLSGHRADGEIHDQEVSVARGAGNELRLGVRVAPLREGRVLVLAEDRTEARRLEEMRRDFTANVSHELKTPIGALSLLAETVTEAADEPATVRHFASQMGREARRLGELVQDLIELSRLQRANALMSPELISVDQVVDEAIDRMQVEAMSRNVQLVLGGTTGLEVFGDPTMLTAAVRNLLDNAVRYSRPYSRVAVGVSYAAESHEVRIAVVDQGSGIAREHQDRVFERFYRGDEARSRETGGSGLGLAIVKHVVADHGGRVELWSTAGTGSTFTIVLPEAQIADIAPMDDVETHHHTGGASGPAAAGHRAPIQHAPMEDTHR